MQTALIIEDDENNMALISFILERSGYATLKAWTGAEGLAAARAGGASFVILDIQLPDISGEEVLERLRSEIPQDSLPVIAMTSYAMTGDRERLLAAGCSGYIEKPIDPERVVQQIRDILDKG